MAKQQKEISTNELFDYMQQGFATMVDKFEKIDERFEKIDERFEKIDERFDRFEKFTIKKFDLIDRRFEYLETKFDKRFDLLTEIIDGYAANLDTYAQEMAAMDHKIRRLEKYIQVIAE